MTSNNACEPGEQLIVLATGDDESDLIGWFLLLLAATVRSFAHMPLGITDCNRSCRFFVSDIKNKVVFRPFWLMFYFLIVVNYMILVYFKWTTHYLSVMFFCWNWCLISPVLQCLWSVLSSCWLNQYCILDWICSLLLFAIYCYLVYQIFFFLFSTFVYR